MNVKSLFGPLLAAVLLQLTNLFFLHFNHHFHPKDFAHRFHPTYSREVSGAKNANLENIFAQPFNYLGSGKQMIAFESQDKQVVLKLFNPMRPLKKQWYKHKKYWLRYSSLKWIKREWFQKKQRLAKLFDRHKIAFELLRDETGLIYVHLSPSDPISQRVQVTDAEGKKHTLDLSVTPFILQKRVTLVPQHLNRLLEDGEVEKAKQAIAKIRKLFEKRLTLGITDRIQTMENNYGFCEGHPIQIDVGRIRIDPKLACDYNAEKERILSQFNKWVQKHYPGLL